MAGLIEHILRATDLHKLRAHACRWLSLPTVTVPSAFVDDAQIDAWTAELYERDMANEPQTRTGEVA